MIGSRYAVIRAYKDLFATPSGKIVFHDLLKQTHLLKTSFAAGNSDVTAFKEGERNIGLKILANIGYDEKELQKLYQEAREMYGNAINNNDSGNNGNVGGW